MKYLRLILIIVGVALVSGCSSEEKVMYMSYSDSNNISSMLNTTNTDSSAANLFANDLCVIPVGTDTGGDTELSGKAEILVNTTSNTVVYANNIYSKLYPASITKIATTLTALKHSDLDSVVTVTENGGGVTESGAKLCGLKKGQKIVLRDLLKAMLVYSGNDAGVEVARHVSGSVEEFATLMNQDAKQLGTVNTNFVNPHGLHDDNHYTTAYDLYLIYNELLSYDFFKEASGLESYTMPLTDTSGKSATLTFENTNQYLLGKSSPPEGVTVIGGKTGTTNKAGKCLALECKDTSGNEYVGIILYAGDSSSNTLYTQMTHMLSKIGQ